MKKVVAASAIALSLLLSTVGISSVASVAHAQTSASALKDGIVNTAKSYMGKVTYMYGVRDSQHLIFDCSSFTQFVFKKNGIYIGWGSNAQTKYGTAVSSKSMLQKGDLVMFSVHTPGKIGHVGIYIGNGKFIHNLPKYGVVISDLYTGYWKDRFITGRHVTK